MTEIKVGWSEGITVATKKCFIRLDPLVRSDGNSYSFISHAHGDHVMGLWREAKSYLTAETEDLISFNGRRELGKAKPLKYGEEINVDDLKVIAHNAGHILGSAQFEIQNPELSIVYTGDINCRDMLTTSAAEVIPCDILVLETTYGNPAYVFPTIGETYTEIVDWIIRQIRMKKIPVFQVYSTGKAQEVIRLVNKFTTVPVVTHPIVSRISEAYTKRGVKLTYIDSDSEEGKDLLRNQQCVYIVPNHELPQIPQKYSLASATGWAIRYKSSMKNAAFPLSNHADFNQLLSYVEWAKPKEVYTIHGFKDDFANYLHRKFNIRAQPIIPFNQRPLGEYL